jgi:hypothetical protein
LSPTRPASGDWLGYYEVLGEDGALTSVELAARTGTHERYAREWLEQQAVTGILEVANAAAPPSERRFHLPAARREVLAHRDNLNYLASLAQLFAGAVRPLPDLVDIYRKGAGIPFHAYGDDAREGQADSTRILEQAVHGGEHRHGPGHVGGRTRTPSGRAAPCPR